MLAQQQKLLGELLAIDRASRMMDFSVSERDDAYSYAEFMSDLVGGVFSEELGDKDFVSPMRRALQRDFLVEIQAKLGEESISAGKRKKITDMGIDGMTIRLNDPAYSEFRGAAILNLKKLDQAFETISRTLIKKGLEGAKDGAPGK